MNNAIVLAAGILFGGIVGGGCTYVYLNKKYTNIQNTELEIYRKENRELKDQNKSIQKSIATKLETEKEKIFDDEGTDDPEDDTFMTNESDIRFISPGDYDDDADYEKEEFKYFESDNVITQDDEVLDIEEFEEVCGRNALLCFGKYDADKDHVFVRNEHFNTDYKITKYHSSYSDYMHNRK